jgi:dihydrofolate reductase
MERKPKICLIAAIADNGVIGRDNKMTWHIESELHYFMEMTRHKPIIMGRKTFDDLGAPLKDRPNIIVTRDASYTHPEIFVTDNLEKALTLAKDIAAKTHAEEIMIGGGAEIYKQTLPLADRLYLTEVHFRPEGNVIFPTFNKNAWRETSRIFHKAKKGETADYTITVLERKMPEIKNLPL